MEKTLLQQRIRVGFRGHCHIYRSVETTYMFLLENIKFKFESNPNHMKVDHVKIVAGEAPKTIPKYLQFKSEIMKKEKAEQNKQQWGLRFQQFIPKDANEEQEGDLDCDENAKDEDSDKEENNEDEDEDEAFEKKKKE